MHLTKKLILITVSSLYITALQTPLTASAPASAPASTQTMAVDNVTRSDAESATAIRDPFATATQDLEIPIYSASVPKSNNPIFKDLIQTKVLVLAENQLGERLAFLQLPMGEILSLQENDTFSMQGSDLNVNTIQVKKITETNMVVTINRAEIILR
tara:strand:+ start:4509 stop:4979 length:471 start_codon:yes stop_codon:yes gene_type:complete